MDTAFLLPILLILGCLKTAEQRTFRSKRYFLESSENTYPSFLRNSVESRPILNSPKELSYGLYQEEFGSKSLPLRTAVEKVPDTVETSKRLPLRDAVEKRLPPYEIELPDDLGVNSIPLASNKVEFVRVPQIPLRDLHQNSFSTSLKDTQYFPLQKFHEAVGLNGRFKVDDSFQSLVNWRPFNRARSPLFENLAEKKAYQPNSDHQKVVCFVDGQAVHRRAPLFFKFEDLDPNACTHVIYQSVSIDPHTFKLLPKDEDFEVIQGGYIALSQLKTKNPDLKILISINSDRFAIMALTSKSRRIFIKSVVEFLQKYHLDGVDIDWIFAQTPEEESVPIWKDLLSQLRGTLGLQNDKHNMNYLLEELKDIFAPMRYLLTISATASKYRDEDGFDGAILQKTVDFVNLKTYDYHKEKEPFADHHAPLNSRPTDTVSDVFNNVEYSVNYWLSKGVSSDKLVLGIPFFGRSFTLQYSNRSGVGSAILGPGREGYYTQTPGLLAYYEICDKILNEGWKKEADAVGSPYVVNGDQWVGYDDQQSVMKKVRGIMHII